MTWPAASATSTALPRDPAALPAGQLRPLPASHRRDAGAVAPAHQRIPRTLVVTSHFAPRHGGVQRFTSELLSRLPADSVGVLARNGAGSGRIDEQLPYPVERFRGHPTTNPGLAHQVAAAVRSGGYDAVWFTSGMPLAAAASAARRAGARRIVVSTHGLEAGWARIPPVRPLIRGASASIDVVTILGNYFRPSVAAALHADVRVEELHGGVDTDRFRPDLPTEHVRASYGLDGRRVVVTVGRLVRRKGHALLLQAWREVLRQHPDAVLLVVGDGYLAARLRRLAEDLEISGSVVFTGTVSDDALPAHLAVADSYVLACRTMCGGMSVEGLGLTTLEASACGLPVVIGDSGGARDAVIPGQTGFLVDTGRRNVYRVADLAERITYLLDHPTIAVEQGRLGRAWVAKRWTWQQMTLRLTDLLA